MHGRSLLGVSLTCASHCADVIALAFDAALSPTSAATQSTTAHSRCGMKPSRQLTLPRIFVANETMLRRSPAKDNGKGRLVLAGCDPNDAVWEFGLGGLRWADLRQDGRHRHGRVPLLDMSEEDAVGIGRRRHFRPPDELRYRRADV